MKYVENKKHVINLKFLLTQCFHQFNLCAPACEHFCFLFLRKLQRTNDELQEQIESLQVQVEHLQTR
jgi:hypothetical protein